MKKAIFITFLLGCISSFLVAQNPFQNTSNTSPFSKPLPESNNITGGLFMGIALGFNTIDNRFKMPLGLETYEYRDKETNTSDKVSTSGIAFEAKLGLVKTFKSIGIRIYGYYGKAYDFYTTLGISSKNSDSDKLLQNGYINSDYYGGILDFMIGSFHQGENAFYFLLGGGYQFTHYGLAGSVSLGDKNGKDIDIYHTKNSAELRTESPLIHFGIGSMIDKHHMIELDFRYLLKLPNIDSTNSISYDSSYTESLPSSTPPRYKNGDLITIKNDFSKHMTLTLSYSYIF